MYASGTDNYTDNSHLADLSQLSDISEFAAWERENPLREGELHELSREQSLIDMARSERVWEGEDSSNDARQSTAEVEGEGVNGGVGEWVKRRVGRKVVLDAVSEKRIGGRELRSSRTLRSRKIEIVTNVVVPEKGLSQDLQGRKLEEGSDNDAPPSSQPRNGSEDEDEDEVMADGEDGEEEEGEGENEVVNEEEAAAIAKEAVKAVEQSAAQETSAEVSEEEEDESKDAAGQDESAEASGEDEEKSVSQQTSAEASDEDEDTRSSLHEEDDMEIDSKSAPEDTEDEEVKILPAVSEQSEEDVLDNVEVAPEEKGGEEEVQSPATTQKEDGMLQRARDGDEYNGTRRLSTFKDEIEFVEYAKTRVELFAKDHPFWSIDNWEDEDMAEFEQDVQQFAIMTGMDEDMADTEVALAVEEWKSSRVKDTMDITFIVNSSPALTTTIPAVAPGSEKKRKRVESKDLVTIPEQIQLTDAKDEEQDAKRQKKESKKARLAEEKKQRAIDRAAAIPIVEEEEEPKEAQIQELGKSDESPKRKQVSNELDGNVEQHTPNDDKAAQSKKKKKAKKTVESVATKKETIEKPSIDTAASEASRQRRLHKKLERKQKKKGAKVAGTKAVESEAEIVEPEKPKAIEPVAVKEEVVEQPSSEEAIAEAKKQRNLAKKLRKQQERLAREKGVTHPAQALDQTKEPDKATKKSKKQRKREAEIGGNEKLNLQSSKDWYGALPEHNTISAKHNTSEQTPIADLTESAAEVDVEALGEKKRKKSKLSKEQRVAQKKSDTELQDKIEAAKSAVKQAIEKAPSKSENKQAASEHENVKRKRKRNKNKLPEHEIAKPIVSAVQITELVPAANSATDTVAGGRSIKRLKKREKSKSSDKPLPKEEPISSQPVVKVYVKVENQAPVKEASKPVQPVIKVSVESEKPASKKRSRAEAEVSDTIAANAIDPATKSDEPRQKRQRTRKTKAEYQAEQTVTAPPAEEAKSIEQEDTPMVDATEALSECMNTNVKKEKKKRSRSRKSMDTKDTEELKDHHLNTQLQDVQVLKQTSKERNSDANYPLSAGYDGIERLKAQTSLAQQDVVVYTGTPSKLLDIRSHYFPHVSSLHSSTSHMEKQSPNGSNDDAESSWGENNYGNTDEDFGNDEIENVKSTPKMMRRATSISSPILQSLPSISGDVPGFYNSDIAAGRENRVKKAERMKRKGNGQFATSIEDNVRKSQSVALAKSRVKEAVMHADGEDIMSEEEDGDDERASARRKTRSSSSFANTSCSAIQRSRRSVRQDLASHKDQEDNRIAKKKSLPAQKQSITSSSVSAISPTSSSPRNESPSKRQRRTSPTSDVIQSGKPVLLAEQLYAENEDLSPSIQDRAVSVTGVTDFATPINSASQPRNNEGKFPTPERTQECERERHSPEAKRESSPVLRTEVRESWDFESLNAIQIKEEDSFEEGGMMSAISKDGTTRPRGKRGRFAKAKNVKGMQTSTSTIAADSSDQVVPDDSEPAGANEPQSTSNRVATSPSPDENGPAASFPLGSMSSLDQPRAVIDVSPLQAEPTQEPQPEAEPIPAAKPKRARAPAQSPYFPSTPKKSNPNTSPQKPTSSAKRRAGLSCIPFPPLSAPYFGLIQEKLAHDPFRLLIAVTFLIRTHGKHAVPIFFQLMAKFPTPESLLAADKEKDILPVIKHLGLQNQRTDTYQRYARIWLEEKPRKGRRYRVLGYPREGDGKDVGREEVLGDEDERVGWEIGHMVKGAYALDSWRIFCRDVLRNLADSWNGEGATVRALQRNAERFSESLDPELSPAQRALAQEQEKQKQEEMGEGKAFQPEWMRVLPLDKELRAYLRWMWLKEGFEWDPSTGDKEVASPELMNAALEGRLEWDDAGGMTIVGKEDWEKRKDV